MLVVLGSLLIMACYLNGFNALQRAFAACAAAVISEAAGRKLFGCPGSLKDLSAVVTALTLVLMLPAVCPVWMVVAGACFAILAVKIPFGGAKKAPFVPAAAAWCFLCVCFSDIIFTCAPVNTGISSAVYGSENFVSGTTVASMLNVGQSITLNLFGATNLLTGRVPGAMGTTCIVAIIGGAAYLLFKRPVRLASSCGFLSVCALMALLFPRVATGRLTSVAMELSAGTLLFVAVFVINDPVTTPKKPLHSFIYGAIAGLLCMLLRYYGNYEDGACFAVLIMNAIRPAIIDYKGYVMKALKGGAIKQAIKNQRLEAAKRKLETTVRRREEAAAAVEAIKANKELPKKTSAKAKKATKPEPEATPAQEVEQINLSDRMPQAPTSAKKAKSGDSYHRPRNLEDLIFGTADDSDTDDDTYLLTGDHADYAEDDDVFSADNTLSSSMDKAASSKGKKGEYDVDYTSYLTTRKDGESDE